MKATKNALLRLPAKKPAQIRVRHAYGDSDLLLYPSAYPDEIVAGTIRSFEFWPPFATYSFSGEAMIVSFPHITGYCPAIEIPFSSIEIIKRNHENK